MINLLGLASRARKTTLGADLTINGVRTNKVKLVFLANDASDNTKKVVRDKTSFYNVVLLEDFNTLELSNALGRNNIKVVGITDQGFSKSILDRKRK